MKLIPRRCFLVMISGATALVIGSMTAHAQEPVISPTPSTVVAAVKVSVRVVYDANNDGRMDASDPDFSDRDAILTAVDGGSPAVPAKASVPVDVPVGVYTVFAIGPTFFSGEAGTPDATCRGWRTSFVDGAPISKAAGQPPKGLGFAVDLLPAVSASSVLEIVLGVSDKGEKGTEFADVQIACPETGGGVVLPSTGSVGARSTMALKRFPFAAGMGLLTLGATCLWLLRRSRQAR